MTPLALLPLVFAPAEVTVQPETYRGWSDSYRISNGVVDLVVVPKIGRIMRFGYVGQRNYLWENAKIDGATKSPAGANVNYGGDKMWPAPQSLWNWPPDPKLDGSVHKLEVIKNGVRLTSPVGAKLRVRFVREITLDQLAPVAKLRNRMHNEGGQQNLAAWQVTQTASPDSVTVPFEPTLTLSKGWHGYGNERLNPRFHSLSGGKLILRRDPKQSRKFGAFSRTGVVEAAFGSTVLQSSSPTLRGHRYVDKDSAMQIYLNADPDAFVELEHTSPVQRMQNGEAVYLDVTWRLRTSF